MPLGMEHAYIKPRAPQLNGKVERSHRTDKDEFYQLLTYKDDVDLEEKLAVWERLPRPSWIFIFGVKLWTPLAERIPYYLQIRTTMKSLRKN